ncbi:MAG: right-handed parallel beta-helix repeat-containing protein, partial [Spartobacteria bacterium]|nr:right-handed parallel beta-helix repeat-containing protein [Spartobacteria bacterium]
MRKAALPMQSMSRWVLTVWLAWGGAGLARDAAAAGTTWYVRVDGGTPDQCTGQVDAPYPGSGSNQPCAWDHPFRALPPGGMPRIAGGDTLIIGPGSYRMGHGAPGADACSSAYPWDCHMPPVPSGPGPTTPTRILGAGWNDGCANKPELWGAERAYTILNLSGATNVEIGCLELSDHLGCAEFHSGSIPCPREEFPYGDWCPRGLYAEDSANVYLHDLDIHGMAYAGIHAGRLTDWRVENVRLAGNGWVGWDGDILGDDGNTGMMFFTNVVVEWNGCGETYPDGQPTGCWAQTAGGYGDGLGTGETGGNWVFENCEFLHNTSDGLDLLYVRRTGSSIRIRNTMAEGNAGNQIKTAGPTTIENCIAVGNCGFFENQPFTHSVDPCRALGNTLSLDLQTGDQVTVANSTITGEGDCLLLAVFGGTTPDGTERVVLRNNIFLGHTDYHQPFENTCLTYSQDFAGDPFDMDYSIIENVKGNPCPVGTNDICGSPLLAGMTLGAFDAMPLSNSPAIDAGVVLANIGVDYAGVQRPLDGRHDGTNVWDIGAYEYIHPLADSDGDGMRDADEMVAGSDATNAASLLELGGVVSGDGPLLDWWGVKRRVYDLQYAPSATDIWEAVSVATNLAGTNGWMTFTNPVPSAHR